MHAANGSDASLIAAVLLFLGLLLVVALTIATELWWRRRQKVSASKALEGKTTAIAQRLRPIIPESHFVVVDNLKIHYLQAGRGRDVILLHGIGASVYVWRFIFPLLEKRFRVTAIDLPGFGKSHKDVRRDYGLDAQTALIGKTIKTMGLRDPILVGSSMGGAIALWLARSEPLRFKKVVALAPATDSRLVPSSLQHFSPFSPLFRRTLNRKTMKLMLKRIITKHSLITDEVVEAYLEPFLDRGDSVRTFWSALSLLADPRLPKDLSAVSADVLVIYGERDLLVSRRSIDRLMKTLPHARLVLHRQAGHHIMEDEPEWLSETIMTFLES